MVLKFKALSDAKSGIIHRVKEPIIAKKLFSMGILPGLHIEIIRRGPLGNAYYCKINKRQRIALRKNEVDAILVV